MSLRDNENNQARMVNINETFQHGTYTNRNISALVTLNSLSAYILTHMGQVQKCEKIVCHGDSKTNQSKKWTNINAFAGVA